MELFFDTWDWLTTAENWSGGEGITRRILQHLYYAVLTLGFASIVAIPLGLYIGHTGRLRTVAIAATGALRALPTLGLLTLFILWFGIGLTGPILALVILAIPPLLAGAYAGLESVDPHTVDAARAQGMTEIQILTRVEIPLALGLIVGGIRSAALQVIATATIASYVALGGLGRFIFDGMPVRDMPRVLGGAVLVIVLALLIDALLAGLQKWAEPKHKAVSR